MIDTFKDAEALGPYDEYPALVASVDPQLHLSRNDRPQPFYLICAKDTLLVQMSGTATLSLKHADVVNFRLIPGDFVYVPGGVPHRLIPNDVSINHRYKAERAGLEGVAWYCIKCGEELHRDVWDTEEELPQEGYARSTARFNAEASLRKCESCGSEHPPLDLAPFRWISVAKELREAVKPADQTGGVARAE
jgi:3-hydroxyanthranilate 3,4-dioxygenase